MKILITGVSGFVGARLAAFLAKQGNEVIGLGRSSTVREDVSKYLLKYISSDITNPLPQITCDVCIHCAALVGDQFEQKQIFNVNVEGTKNVLQAIPESATMIHLSSPSVYAYKEMPHVENEIIDKQVLFPYGHSKLLADEYLQSCNRKGNIFMLRPRAIYGIGDKSILPRILRLGQTGSIMLPGKINAVVSMTHIVNLLFLIEKIIHVEPKGINEVYNIADEETYRFEDIIIQLNRYYYRKTMKIIRIPRLIIQGYAKLKKALKLPGNISPESLAYVHNNCILDLSKIKRDFEYHPRYTFYESLDEIIEWAKEDAEEINLNKY